MSTKTKIVLSRGGSKERTVKVSDIVIPDLWHIAQSLQDTGTVTNGPACAKMILDCWGLTHGLLSHIQSQPD